MHSFPTMTANINTILHAKHGSKDFTFSFVKLASSYPLPDKIRQLLPQFTEEQKGTRQISSSKWLSQYLNAQSDLNVDSLNHLIYCCAQ